MTEETDKRVTTNYEDVLQNMEMVIQQIDTEADDLVDVEVLDAIDALFNAYSAELKGRNAPTIRLSPLKRKIYDGVREVCEFRLGRESIQTADGKPLEVKPEPISVEAVAECLKRIRASIRRWNASNGRRGYLEFTATFFPSISQKR